MEKECNICHKLETEYWLEKYGMCFWCNNKQQDEKWKKQIVKETLEKGSSYNEDIIICPYCGYENDDCEMNETTDTYCDECGKKFHLEVEWSASYSTNKIEDKNE
jgi:hypothetical protein